VSDVPEQIKEAFSGKQGKIMLVGGVIAVAVYVWYVRSNPTSDPLAEEDPSAGNTDGVRTPQTPPTTGNQTEGTGTKRPTTNGEWLADATDFLTGRGVSAGDAYSALSKALGGQQLTTAERAWVSQAMSGVGTPPDGMPPLQSAPPTGSTPKPTPTGQIKTALKAPTGLKTTRVDRGGVGLGWNDVPGAKGYIVSVNGKPTVQPWTSGTPVTGLRPGTRYTISVKAVGTGGQTGPAASIPVTTKK
jgi:hypothetical protein